jgi:hypothetical protein
MNITIVGGSQNKESSIIKKIATEFRESISHKVLVYNGTTTTDISGADLTIWMPDIPNELPKKYPKKDKGSVLICSKVIHNDRTEVDAVSRIFDMNGNAVICIYKDDINMGTFRFKLIDALGHVWIETYVIRFLVQKILELYKWTKLQVRLSLEHSNEPVPDVKIPEIFVDINTRIADKIENALGSRYFGNFSTRCMKLFPSFRTDADSYLFSPRNIDKRRLTVNDFVFVKPPYYYGDRKYSVDAPVQIALYRAYNDINFMIHGHAFVKGYRDFPVTENYYPCGDLREVHEISVIFDSGIRIVNVKNHGFLLASTDLKTMDEYARDLEFEHNSMLED